MNPIKGVEGADPVEVVAVSSTDILLLDDCMITIALTLIYRDTPKATNQGWGDDVTAWESAAPIAEAERDAEKEETEQPTIAPEDTPASAAETSKEPEKEPQEEDQTQTYADW